MKLIIYYMYKNNNDPAKINLKHYTTSFNHFHIKPKRVAKKKIKHGRNSRASVFGSNSEEEEGNPNPLHLKRG